MSHEPFAPHDELEALAAGLGALAPARSQIDRDRVMFRAGQAAAARPSATGRRLWMAIAAGLGLISLSEAALLVRRPPPRVIERVVVVHEPAPAPVAPAREGRTVSAPTPGTAVDTPEPVELALGRTPYERLAGQVLRYGLDGLPAPPPAGPVDAEPWPAPSRQGLKEQIDKVLDSGDAS